MPDTDALILYLIDRSASMRPKIKATCDGFNEFIKEQACLQGGLISVVLFDDRFEVPIVAMDAQEVPLMSTTEGTGLCYSVRGTTALRDAIGITVAGGETWLDNHPNFSGKVVMCIMTDGLENASWMYTSTQIRAMIEAKKTQGWTFVFQGAGDSFLQGTEFGIDHTHAVADSAAGIATAYAGNAIGVYNLRSTGAYNQAPNTKS